MRRGWRIVTALTATMVALVAMAPPASAATVGLEATGGTLIPSGGPIFGIYYDFGPADEEAPCAKPSSLQLDTDSPAAGQWALSGTTTQLLRLGTPPAGPWYQLDHTIMGTGTYSGTTSPYSLATTAPWRLTFLTRVYELDAGCEKDVQKCVIAARVVVTSGSYTGTLPASASGDTMTFSGSTNIAGGLAFNTSSCAAPWVAFNGQHATLTNLTLEVV